MVHALMIAALVSQATASLACGGTTIAQESERVDGSIAYLPSLRGDYFLLHSQETGRDYHIYVRLPHGYTDAGNQRYPVVYLLDGDTTFPMLAPLHLFLQFDDKLPEAIIVGIAYGSFLSDTNKRDVDFQLILQDGREGGALQFLAMLENELVPRIDQQFRTDPERRIIFGQSRGGSAVLQAAWLKPGLFWGHIASNPGLEADTGQLFGMDRAPPVRRQGGYLIVASGSRDREHLRKRALEWRDRVASRNDLPWTTRFVDIEGGTHAANLGDAYRAGMRLMFTSPTPTRD